jgi:hypothetical protein
MALGAVWLPQKGVQALNSEIRDLKFRYGCQPYQEMKWTKVSPSYLKVYESLIDLFFSQQALCFRAIVVRGKSRLQHNLFRDQDHDTWYYKMYYLMLEGMLSSDNSYFIYVDFKDTLGGRKIQKLQEVLRNKHHDSAGSVIRRLQIARSHEVQLFQVVDVLLGALTFNERLAMMTKSGNAISPAKLYLVDKIKALAKHDLVESSYVRDTKFNVFYWHPQDT